METNENLTELLEYQGLKVHYLHYNDCKSQKQMVEKFKDQIDYLKENPEIKHLIVDYNGASIGTEYMAVAKSHSAFWDSRELVMIGVDGLKKILLKGYNTVASNKVIAFDTKEEALEALLLRP
ncbi:hypothetical protein [Reichenbachiella versicolor]|uniref:hypothetical protein n=1 Tax=Reichenbachiella versicolor TaxID=1821036 RepID=UPI000D6E0FF3|nr:hypothetical protein [Reichenbachiella versicolor]